MCEEVTLARAHLWCWGTLGQRLSRGQCGFGDGSLAVLLARGPGRCSGCCRTSSGPPQGFLAGTTFPGRTTSQEVESFALVSPCETSTPWFPGRLLQSRGTSQRGRWCLCLFLASLEHLGCPRTQQDLLLARPEVLSRMEEGWDSPPRGAWGPGPDSWVRVAGRRWFSNIWSIRALFSNRILPE